MTMVQTSSKTARAFYQWHPTKLNCMRLPHTQAQVEDGLDKGLL